jgi:predicted PurR-regulated permease PerM
VDDPLMRRLVMLTTMGIVGWLIWLLQPVLAPFLAAFIVAYLLNPLVEKLMHYGHLPRWICIFLVFMVMGSVLLVATWLLIPMLWEQMIFAKEHIPDAIAWLNGSVRPWLRQNLNVRVTHIDPSQVTDWLVSYLQTNYNAGSTQEMLTSLARSSLNIINVAGLVVLVPIVAFYFLLDWRNMLARLRLLLPRRAEPTVVRLADECNDVLGAFVKGQLLVMLLLGAVYAIGLQLVGVRVGLIIGLVAGIASIIPYLGFAVGLIAAIIATLFQFGMNWMQISLVGLVFFIGQMIEGYVLQPFLLGDKIGLSPVAVIFAIMAGAQLFGFVGMLLALPVAAVLVVLLRHAHQSYQSSHFYRVGTVQACDTEEQMMGATRPLVRDESVDLP